MLYDQLCAGHVYWADLHITVYAFSHGDVRGDREPDVTERLEHPGKSVPPRDKSWMRARYMKISQTRYKHSLHVPGLQAT